MTLSAHLTVAMEQCPAGYATSNASYAPAWIVLAVGSVGALWLLRKQRPGWAALVAVLMVLGLMVAVFVASFAGECIPGEGPVGRSPAFPPWVKEAYRSAPRLVDRSLRRTVGDDALDHHELPLVERAALLSRDGLRLGQQTFTASPPSMTSTTSRA